jgi:pantoate--beta-alanine ligase
MSVKLISTIAKLREHLKREKATGAIVGLVPTMGALHAGHTRLIDQAVQECGHVVVTLFVNPIQFNQQGDYQRYPRNVDDDLEVCERQGAHVLFAPSLEEMYPDEQRAFVEVTHLGDHLCGEHRPGHFRGVTTVVMKLFNIAQPDRAYFGEKDAQQLALISRMAGDLNLPVTIVPVATVREHDGLALSSRNKRLDPEQRRVAVVLYEALRAGEAAIARGACNSGEVIKEARRAIDQHPEVRLEYFEVVDPEQLQPVSEITGPVRIAGAIWVGSTRLIDNLLCGPVQEPTQGPASRSAAGRVKEPGKEPAKEPSQENIKENVPV